VEIVKHWYVAKTRARQEKVVQQRLQDLGVETFLPSRMEVRQWHDRKKKVEVMLIPNTIFVHEEKAKALSMPNKEGVLISYMIDYMTRSMLVVPDRQMENFMFLMDVSEDAMKINNDVLYLKGDKIRVVKGPFAGLEGELMRIDGNDKVVVKLDGLLACVVEIAGGFLEKV